MNVKKVSSESFVEEAVSFLVERLDARDKNAPFHIFLSGGTTPKPIYRALAEEVKDWTDVHLWLGDERYVPLDHPDSNYKMVSEAFAPAELPSQQLHQWPILASPERSAETYDGEFRTIFEQEGQTLNLQILGMGDDGHTASLFPQSPALAEKKAMCVANQAPGVETTRLTLTFPALALSQDVLFLAKGAAKAETLKEVIEEGLHPASQVRGRASTTFLVDEAAAAKLA